MKAITEFNVFNIKRAMTIKNDLATQGKTPEEISAGIGEAFKLEGDKLKFFVNSLTLVDEKAEGLKRIMVVTFGEGETVPERYKKVEEQHFLLEFFTAPYKAPPKEDNKRGKGRGGRGGDRDNKGGGGLRGGPKGPKKDDAGAQPAAAAGAKKE